LSINICSRELEAAQQALSAATVTYNRLSAAQAERADASRRLAVAADTHARAMAEADAGLAPKSVIQASRDEIHALRQKAAQPDLSRDLADAEAHMLAARDASRAAGMHLLRAVCEELVSQQQAVAFKANQLNAIAQGLRQASAAAPYQIGNLVSNTLGALRATAAQVATMEAEARAIATEARDLCEAALHGTRPVSIPKALEG
jgi:hypothetical protein